MLHVGRAGALDVLAKGHVPCHHVAWLLRLPLMCFLLSPVWFLLCSKGYYDNADIAHNIIPHMRDWGAAAVTLHGRSRQQRYSRAADWEYIR